MRFLLDLKENTLISFLQDWFVVVLQAMKTNEGVGR